MLVELQDGDVRRIAERVLAAGSDDDTPILTIRAVIALDTVRHLHMTTLETADKRAYLNSTLIRSLLESDSSVPAHLKVKLQHAVNMQERVLMDSGDGVLDG
jgi:hypothetical protein